MPPENMPAWSPRQQGTFLSVEATPLAKAVEEKAEGTGTKAIRRAKEEKEKAKARTRRAKIDGAKETTPEKIGKRPKRSQRRKESKVSGAGHGCDAARGGTVGAL